jgi:hypothetical protein
MNSREALKVAFKNQAKRWVPVIDKEKNNPLVALNRFKKNDYFFINSTPSFQIEKGSSIYTVGSCFARNVERSMALNGMDVIGMDFSLDTNLLHDSVGAMNNAVNSRSILNKYSTFAICEEFQRVLEKKSIKDNGFIEIKEGEWIDPQLAAVMKVQPFDILNEVRMKVDNIIKNVVNADLVFITLGLNEVWKDNESNTFLNSSPPPMLMRGDNERFSFSCPSYADVYEHLEKAINLINEKSTKDVKFIITVSPVPMATTWTSKDIVVANSDSKAVLKICADALSQKYTNIDYFPSYEMVMNTPRNLAWQDDQLHVKAEMVDFIMQEFVKRYVTE